jgi:hypothetical protein
MSTPSSSPASSTDQVPATASPPTASSGQAVLCWAAIAPRVGTEHLVVSDGRADGAVVGLDDEAGPFRLQYELGWDPQWRVRRAVLTAVADKGARSLQLQSNGRGRWRRDGVAVAALDGCVDIDIWPTPFTNSFPIRREPLAVGERRTFTMAWVDAVRWTVEPKPQAYTRLDSRRYRFESLDGSGFTAELATDANGFVLDYPGLFRRTWPRA